MYPRLLREGVPLPVPGARQLRHRGHPDFRERSERPVQIASHYVNDVRQAPDYLAKREGIYALPLVCLETGIGTKGPAAVVNGDEAADRDAPRWMLRVEAHELDRRRHFDRWHTTGSVRVITACEKRLAR